MRPLAAFLTVALLFGLALGRIYRIEDPSEQTVTVPPLATSAPEPASPPAAIIETLPARSLAPPAAGDAGLASNP